MGRKRLGRWAYIWDYRLKPPATKVCKAYNPGPPIPNKFWALCSIRGGDPRAGRSGYGSQRRKRIFGTAAFPPDRRVHITRSSLAGAGGGAGDYDARRPTGRRNLGSSG